MATFSQTESYLLMKYISLTLDALVGREGGSMDLEKFAKKMFELSDWPEGGDIDGFDFQEAATECGLLTPETRTEPCGDNCHCAEYRGDMSDGVTCFRKAPFLMTPNDQGNRPQEAARFLRGPLPAVRVEPVVGRLETELERERMRLAACGVVALANTPESAKEARRMHDDYRSASCDDVARAVDREIAYRHALEILRDGLKEAKNANLVDYIDAVLTPNS